MWLRLRAWWYIRSKGEMPRDVREYVIRRYMKSTIETLTTPEQKNEFIKHLMEGAMGLDRDQISDSLRDELIKTAFQLVGEPEPMPRPPDGPYPSGH